MKKIFNYIKKIFNLNYDKKINKSLFELSKIDEKFALKFIDVGAAEDIHPRWKRVIKFTNYIGFEPDKRSSDLLNENKNCKSYKIYPFALWSKKQKLNINFTQEPRVSSYYYPNSEFLNRYKNAERFKILKQLEVDSIDLDSLEIAEIDFIKIDIQGGELEVINGAKESLKGCLGLELEVEFLDLYKGQPLFGDLKRKLLDYGLEFIDFINLCRWERDRFNGFGHCVFGDAIFLKSPEFIFSENNQDLISRYLAILLLYKRFDLIDKCFSLMDQKQKTLFGNFKRSIKPIRKNYNSLIFYNKIFNALVSLKSSDNKVFMHY
ncbi:FkbM family methyltransferase [Flavobacteriaceae bacterium]|nr:FkbM family methyltransferase [Flavobacteriaceae bacterium]